MDLEKQFGFTEEMWTCKYCRRMLDAMFFGHDDLIPKGSQEYKDFEDFAEKYLEHRFRHPSRKRKLPGTENSTMHRAEEKSNRHQSISKLFDFPKNYDKRYTLNFAVVYPNADLKDHGRHLPKAARQAASKNSLAKELLTGPGLEEFRKIIQLYVDFALKDRFSKINKIKQSQRDLPIASQQEQILAAVKQHSVVIVAGDTGCGKSTQVPQYLLKAGYSRIACTQPRRISAIALCRRVAHETLNEYGDEVAYHIRFDTSKTANTRILFLTEGLLVRQLLGDPDLSEYNVIIIDEVHERHVTCDFLLGLLKAVLIRRSDLKVVLMSATINTEMYSQYFNSAPVICVPGRMFSVKVEYLPPPLKEQIHGTERRKGRRKGRGFKTQEMLNPAPYLRLLQKIDHSIPSEERGDLLCFFSGMAEILRVAEALSDYVQESRRWIVLLLHSTLSVEDQDKVFDPTPPGIRKCILATNIAETSVTINGIRFVADSGKEKQMRWDPVSGTRALQECWVSQASANQRKGRAGRTGPGTCFRMYSKDDYKEMDKFPLPEVVRSPLEATLLQMKVLGMQDPRRFPFLTDPPESNLDGALLNLTLNGALELPPSLDQQRPKHGKAQNTDDKDKSRSETEEFQERVEFGVGKVTALGRALSNLPVDCNVGKMLVLGALLGRGLEDSPLTDHSLCLAAALSIQSPFKFSRSNTPQDSASTKFDSPDGDPFTIMNVYDEWLQLKNERTTSSRKWCKRYGIQEQRLYEVSKLIRQFRSTLKHSGIFSVEDDDETSRKPHSRSDIPEKRKRQSKLSRRQLQRLRLQQDKMRSGRTLQLNDSATAFEDADEEENDTEDDQEYDDQKGWLTGETLAPTGHEAEDLSNLDLHSLEFYMNLEKQTSRNNDIRQRSEINVLKYILASGSYPQLALFDSQNVYRPLSEHQYHTRHRTGLKPIPGSVICATGEEVAERLREKGCGLGELLLYGELVETQKPYLSQLTPVPALPILLLCSRHIDTDPTGKYMLFDHWLHLKCESETFGQQLLLQACRIRIILGSLVGFENHDSSYKSQRTPIGVKSNFPKMLLKIQSLFANQQKIGVTEEDPCRLVSDFMGLQAHYTLERIAPYELEDLFLDVINMENAAEACKVLKECGLSSQGLVFPPNQFKRGVQVCDYLRFGSLLPKAEKALFQNFNAAAVPENNTEIPKSSGLSGMSSSSHIRKWWECPRCTKRIMANLDEIRDHTRQCSKEKNASKTYSDGKPRALSEKCYSTQGHVPLDSTAESAEKKRRSEVIEKPVSATKPHQKKRRFGTPFNKKQFTKKHDCQQTAASMS